ncbi:MAG: putative LPS assembly protein LptD [Muribaculaceae bacterium]|nr:putative LPS assembly protein LptD [Muribaculaceae bacterium]
MKIVNIYIAFLLLIILGVVINTMPLSVLADNSLPVGGGVSLRGHKPKVDSASIKEAEKDNINRIVDGIKPQQKLDTITISADSTLLKNQLGTDSLTIGKRESINDTLANDSAPKSKFVKQMVDLDNSVDFSAKDSLIFYGKSTAFMYGKSAVKYGTISLDASEIRMNMRDNTVYAVGSKDSVGDLQDNPIFKDPSGEYESKTMRYNFKTKKGYITDVITQQGEGYLTGGITKKMENDEYYIKDGRYTTCDDHDCPHFYFQITKGKVKPKKNIVTGPVYLVLADVPLPLAVPFGFFPFSDKYSSGIIMPTFGEDYNKGFYLRDGGYYFAINDNIDLALTGELYTKGSWGITGRANYVKRYKFSGSFDISYLSTVEGDKGSADYLKSNNFKLAWTHTQDSKANPNMSFSASVNFATSGYSRNDLNSYYNNSFTENTKSSTVNMTYRFPNSKWSLSTTANVSQRTADSTLTVSFPNVSVTMSQVAPFKRKRAVGNERWYEKIKMSYSGYFQNSLTAKQDEFFQKSLIKDWKNGMKHSVPISATFNILKYINLTPSITLNDRMYSNKIRKAWDPDASREINMDTVYNFYNVFDFNGAVSLDTKIYGFFQPMKFLGDKVKVIRHVLTPTISFSASPDFSSPTWGYYGNYNYTQDGQVINKKYSYFQHGMFGSVGEGKTGAVSWSLANNLEMKVKSDADSTGVKKVSLIENLSISQSYNFAADSMRWSNINTSLMLRLVKNFNLSLSATWDVYTYQLNSSGNPVRVNIPRWEAGKGLGKLSSTGTSFSYTFNNQTFQKKKKEKTASDENNNTSPAIDKYRKDDEPSDGKDDKKKDELSLNPDGYVKWDCPWSLTVNYSVNYGYGTFNKEKLEYDGKFTQNLSFSGNIRPTKNWNFNLSASYNFDTGKIAYMNCTISRDLHCFTMSASFVPVGPYKSYNFHIAVKSSMLSDLKYDKRSSNSNGVDWY